MFGSDQVSHILKSTQLFNCFCFERSLIDHKFRNNGNQTLIKFIWLVLSCLVGSDKVSHNFKF